MKGTFWSVATTSMAVKSCHLYSLNSLNSVSVAMSYEQHVFSFASFCQCILPALAYAGIALLFIRASECQPLSIASSKLIGLDGLINYCEHLYTVVMNSFGSGSQNL